MVGALEGEDGAGFALTMARECTDTVQAAGCDKRGVGKRLVDVDVGRQCKRVARKNFAGTRGLGRGLH
eukprot:11225519-Prorocentrum_lima.AAC.1